MIGCHEGVRGNSSYNNLDSTPCTGEFPVVITDWTLMNMQKSCSAYLHLIFRTQCFIFAKGQGKQAQWVDRQ